MFLPLFFRSCASFKALSAIICNFFFIFKILISTYNIPVKDFFQTLLKPDWDDNPKKSEILLAANKLEVGEFQFLQLAYKEWHGHELPKTLVDNIFRGYTIRNNIPNWARHYARKNSASR